MFTIIPNRGLKFSTSNAERLSLFIELGIEEADCEGGSPIACKKTLELWAFCDTKGNITGISNGAPDRETGRRPVDNIGDSLYESTDGFSSGGKDNHSSDPFYKEIQAWVTKNWNNIPTVTRRTADETTPPVESDEAVPDAAKALGV